MDRMPSLTSPCFPANPPLDEPPLECEDGRLVEGTSDEDDATAREDTAAKDESTA